MSRKRREEEKKMPFIVATYVYACSPRAAHALRSDQKYFSKVYGTRKCCKMLILCHSVRHSLSHTVNFIITQSIHPTRKLLLQNIYLLV